MLYLSALALKSHYPLNLNWKMCLIGRNQKLARNDSYSEDLLVPVKHNVTHALIDLILTTTDLDNSETVMHQTFFDDQYLAILQRTHSVGYVHGHQNLKVTANGPADPGRVLMRLKVIEDQNRSNVNTMELNHTGE